MSNEARKVVTLFYVLRVIQFYLARIGADFTRVLEIHDGFTRVGVVGLAISGANHRHTDTSFVGNR